MAKYVHEIMNPELFKVEPDTPRQDTLDFLLLLGVTGCPVIDEAGKIHGIVTIRDLVSEDGGGRVYQRISEPAVTIARSATVEDAARKLSEYHAHRLIVEDEKRRVVGIVSAVDLVAALVGAPVTHPKGFPRGDENAAIGWTEQAVLEPESTEEVPNAPGVITLIYSSVDHVDVPLWVEAANNLRARLDDLVSDPQQDSPALAYLLTQEHGHLQFRAAVVEDPVQREQVVAQMLANLRKRTGLRG